MSGTASAADEIIAVGRKLPRIRAVAPLDGRRVRLIWRTGNSMEIDLNPAFLAHRAFARLRTDDELFRDMRVNEEGTALEWSDGAELSALWIEELTLGQMTNAEFRRAMDEIAITLDGMAARLGISRRMVAAYRKDKPIPSFIALATRYLVEQLKFPKAT